MKIEKIEVRNFRLLKNTEINLEDNLSLVIGKNNTGKTSFLAIMERFLNSSQNNFKFDDFNLKARAEFKNKFDQNTFDESYEFGIDLKFYVNYTEEDNLANISNLLLDLEPDQNTVIIKYSYNINYESLNRLKIRFDEFNQGEGGNSDILSFLQENHKSFFQIRKQALENGNESNFNEINDTHLLSRIINFKKISAKRDVVNPDGSSSTGDKTLSRQSARFFEAISNDENLEDSLKKLNKHLKTIDKGLDEAYKDVFVGMVGKIIKFGGLKRGETDLEIKSAVQSKNLLKDNTNVMYSQQGSSLPEDYYGLGYLNLISMIIEIEIALNDFKKKGNSLEEPADLNLFFIEEPEAHTHPQMQYIFIKNIKELLEEERTGALDNISIGLQTIMSTHSSHITAESDFDDIKYFLKESDSSVISKNLKVLKKAYDDDTNQYEFLKKYLTLNRAELFFAEKAILIEGDTERIILPSVMKKIDLENSEEEDYLPLLSQNISIIESGAYSQIFEKFINFLGIKALIVTDLDSVDEDKNKVKVKDGVGTSNSALTYFFDGSTFDDIVAYSLEQKIFINEDGKWSQNKDGSLMLVYQTEELGYKARSFEDSFININYEYIKNNLDNFKGLKKKNEFNNDPPDPFKIAEDCIKKKTDFALDIIYNSSEKFDNWSVPEYIKEGLEWLGK